MDVSSPALPSTTNSLIKPPPTPRTSVPSSPVPPLDQRFTPIQLPLPSARPPTDYTSDKATAAFIRGILCAHHLHGDSERRGGGAEPLGIDQLLPPLTSSNAIDLQLYAFIAIIVKEYIHPWYTRITSDHAFVDELIQIIAHCTRVLEQRLRKVDLEALALEEIPALLRTHIESKHKVNTIWMETYAVSHSCRRLSHC